MIREVRIKEIETCLQIIRESFGTVAQEFNLTQANCPEHTSFMRVEKLCNSMRKADQCLYM